MFQTRVLELEISLKQIPSLCNKMIAFVPELKCFVYKDAKGDLAYFEDTPEFRKAHQESIAECIRSNQCQY